MGFLESLFIVFLVLKLVGVITWSWTAVFTPLFIAWGFYLLLIIVITVIHFIKKGGDIDG